MVQDTNVFVAALRRGSGASRSVLLACLRRAHDPLMGMALWSGIRICWADRRSGRIDRRPPSSGR